MKDIDLDEERENVFNRFIDESNEARGDYEKSLLHDNTLDVYMKGNNLMVKGGILWKFQFLMGGSWFGKLLLIMVPMIQTIMVRSDYKDLVLIFLVNMVCKRENDSTN